MAYQDWQHLTEQFATIDVRHIQGHFVEAIKKRAMTLPAGEGLHIIQTFEPYPLYGLMTSLGYESHTDQSEDYRFDTYFYRIAVKQDEDLVFMKPAALTNMPLIDDELGVLAVNFWNLTWNDEKRYLPYEFRLLLSLTNAVGAGRMTQASRELVKAYCYGLDSRALDDVFELLVWNQGIGYFSSEIGTSTLFKVYKTIKKMESQGKSRLEIIDTLKKNFGEHNPALKVMD